MKTGPAGPARKRGTLLLLLALSCAVPVLLPVRVAAQQVVPLRVDGWTTGEGLPSQTINDLVQTPDGYLWIATAGGLVRFDGLDFVLFPVGGADGLPTARVTGLGLGRGDTLWIVTEEGHLVHRTGGRFSVLTGPGAPLLDVAQDAEGTVWVSQSPGLLRYQAGALQLVHDVDVLYMTRDYHPIGPQFTLTRGGQFWLREDTRQQMMLVRGGRLEPGPAAPTRAIVTRSSQGDVLFVRARGTLYDVVDSAGAVVSTFRPGPGAIPRLVDRRGLLWVTTDDAIEVFAPSGGEPVARVEPGAGTGIGVMIEDGEGNIWAGTGVHGLIRIRSLPFRAYGRAEGFREDQVISLARGRAGSVLATDRRWNVYRITDRGVGPVFAAGPGEDHAWAAFEDARGTLWLGRGGGTPRRHFIEGRRDAGPPIVIDLPSRALSFQVTEDPSDPNTLWVADRRVYRVRPYDPVPGITETYLSDGERTVRHILPARDGTVWVATSNGLGRIQGGVVTFFGVADGLPVEHVRAVHEDDAGILWIGTYGGGIVRYMDGRFQAVREADGLYEDIVSTILEDDFGNFWMSGNRGVHRVARAELMARLDGERTRVNGVNYGRLAGIPNPEASGWQAHRGSDGRLWFPTYEGVVVVDPAFALAKDAVAPIVHVHAVRTRERTLPVLGPDVLRLRAGERRVEFDYTGISLSNADAVAFEYHLAPLDEGWIRGGNARTTVYTNLRAGSYTFRVRAMSAGGTWSTPVSVPIEVDAHFHETLAFYILCALALLALGYALYRFRVRQLRRREALLRELVAERTHALAEQKERAEGAITVVNEQAEQLRSLHAARTRFFANASHELRTPLTLILAPLQDLEEGRAGELGAAARSRISSARRNGHQLTRLVDQLLDVARMEASTLRLDLQPCDAAAFLAEMGQSFQILAQRAGIDFVQQLPRGPLPCRIDPAQVERILMNLLGNAFKFTPPGGRITLHAWTEPAPAGEQLCIAVADTGPGIGPADLPHIFDRFYQVNSTGRQPGGIGVGLTLARELVHLHGGTIAVRSRPGEGATFTVNLPLQGVADVPVGTPAGPERGEWPEPADDDAIADAVAAHPSDPDVPTILLVEDNVELRSWVRTRLAGSYRVLEAADGAAGLAIARDVVPDVIVSDVMMPGMDGEAMVRAIRNDPDIDFLPVILLTARASSEARLSGLEGGADDYLAKPFDIRELLVRIRNLIAARRRLRERLALQTSAASRPSPAAAATTPRARALLAQVYAVLADNIADEEFTVDQLASAVAMSRATLYRQLRPFLTVSPMELIWHYRLEQAALWLTETDGSVSEIAYSVGFKSVPHFCRRFRDQFGVSPSAYRQDPASATHVVAHAAS